LLWSVVYNFPITTVASESAFSAGGRVLDDYQSSLMKDMVEILVCGGDWIKTVSKTTIQTLQVRFSFQISFISILN
jgi:hAT family C-terminal dimerisation region